MSTKLRYIKSKKEENLIQYVNTLPYKIEIKGAPLFVKNKWFLWFNLSDESFKEVPSGDIDK